MTGLLLPSVFTGIAFVLVFICRAATGLWVNPVSAFLASWLPMVAILSTGWLSFFRLEEPALFLAISSISAFVLGSCLFRDEPRIGPKAPNVDPLRLHFLLLVLAGLGLAGFAGFLVTAVRAVGFYGVFMKPWILRSAMNDHTFTDPFRFINYANIVFPVMVLIGRESLGKMARGWYLAAVLSGLSTVFGTGRTKPVWVLVWAGFVYLLSGEKRNIRRALAAGGAVLVLTLVVFGCLGLWVGKTLGPEDIERNAPSVPEGLEWLVNPGFYLAAGLPYFQEFVADPPESPPMLFANLLLPYYKVFGLFEDRLEVPGEILEERSLPRERLNTGTWLIQFYADAGAVGVIVFPFLVGAFTCRLITTGRWARNDPRRLYLGGLFLYLIWIGFLGNKFVSTPTWIFLGIGYPPVAWICRDQGSPS